MRNPAEPKQMTAAPTPLGKDKGIVGVSEETAGRQTDGRIMSSIV